MRSAAEALHQWEVEKRLVAVVLRKSESRIQIERFSNWFFYQYLYRFLLLLIYKLKGEKIVYMYVYVHIVVVLQKNGQIISLLNY